ncbi:MAG TPA: M50 family metallopeptidase [Actinophytocola sp.]|nr:M50 family metallopeptidase [Actinophytocola sp.]
MTTAKDASDTAADPGGLPAAMAQARPALREGVRLGRSHRRAAAVVHHIKDPETGWFYRVGPREHAILSMMDGQRTVAEIGAEYADRFGRLLGQDSWQQVFTMLGTRQLLAGAVQPEALERLRTARAEEERTKRSVLRRRMPLVAPGPLFDRLAPRLGAFFSPWFVVPAFAAVLAMLVYVLAGFGELRADLAAGPGLWVYLGPTLVVSWLLLAIHESAHGLVCTRFGGRVDELGVMWRFPIVAPYCKTDDVVLMTRAQGVAVAFAGVFSNLVALLPFAVAHWLAEPGGAVRGFCAGVLMFGVASSLVNLVPFLQLDGYHMINNALGTLDLRGESYKFCAAVLRDRATVRGYPTRDKWAYSIYGLASLLFTLGVVGALATLWFTTMRPWFGPVGAAAVLIVEAILVVALLGWAASRRRAPAN